MEPHSDRVVTVLTLNLWNRAPPWDERLAVIRAGIEALRPDVIALQEVIALPELDFDQAELVAEGFGYESFVGRGAGDALLLSNAVLSRFPIVQREVVTLPDLGHPESRCALLTRLATPWGALPFVTTHLNWKLDQGHVRCAQVRHLVAALDASRASGDLPAIVAGDFNAEPDSDEMRYLRGATGLGGPCVYFNDCWQAAGDGSAGATFALRNPYAALSREPDRRIDYVFVRGPDDHVRGVPLECRVCFDAPVDGVWASDHFGLFARIEL
ncbi:MAG: endonuclease/exonuclease/phosphatase family protein [Polyangiales bacterium]